MSEDDGRTWTAKLLLDDRHDVSCPDAVESAECRVFAIYDRERGGVGHTGGDAREILKAVFTWQDILAGAVASATCRLR